MLPTVQKREQCWQEKKKKSGGGGGGVKTSAKPLNPQFNLEKHKL